MVIRVRLPFERHIEGYLSRLAPTTRAALWMLVGGFCAVMMNVLIRVAAQRMHPFEVTFFRCLFSLGFMAPFIIRAGPALLHNQKIGFFTLRAAVGLVSMLTWFYGITLVPLATATAVNFTAPLFATMGAALILHEDVRLRRWSAVAIGFVGVLVILRPGRESIDINLLLILLSAASAAMNNITVKYLVRTERPNVIVAMFVLYLTPLSLLPALFVWSWPDPRTLLALVGLGGLGTLAHISVTRAYAAADASACAPYEFLRLPFAALIGFLLFGELTDAWTWAGAAIIVGASMYVAYREAHVAKHGRKEAGAPVPAR
jgi:drug/metabolite transporter (DMT)-like permease